MRTAGIRNFQSLITDLHRSARKLFNILNLYLQSQTNDHVKKYKYTRLNVFDVDFSVHRISNML